MARLGLSAVDKADRQARDTVDGANWSLREPASAGVRERDRLRGKAAESADVIAGHGPETAVCAAVATLVVARELQVDGANDVEVLQRRREDHHREQEEQVPKHRQPARGLCRRDEPRPRGARRRRTSSAGACGSRGTGSQNARPTSDEQTESGYPHARVDGHIQTAIVACNSTRLRRTAKGA